jgi:hypothetical protein
MIKDLKNNLILKEFYKKPNFIDDKFILKSKKYLLENDLDSFFRLVKINLENKKVYSNKVFHVYFYLLNLLEKEGKTNSFLEYFVYSKLSHKKYFLQTNIVDKEIYDFLEKHYTSFEKIKEKDALFIKVDKDFLKLKKLTEKFNYFNDKTIKKDIIEIISFLKKLNKEKKISKKIANQILEYVEYDISGAFDFYKNKDSVNLFDFVDFKKLKI